MTAGTDPRSHGSLGIARNVLRDSARRDRIATRARERLGLPVHLAGAVGHDDVEERLSPGIRSTAPSPSSRSTNGTRSSCATVRVDKPAYEAHWSKLAPPKPS